MPAIPPNRSCAVAAPVKATVSRATRMLTVKRNRMSTTPYGKKPAPLQVHPTDGFPLVIRYVTGARQGVMRCDSEVARVGTKFRHKAIVQMGCLGRQGERKGEEYSGAHSNALGSHRCCCNGRGAVAADATAHVPHWCRRRSSRRVGARQRPPAGARPDAERLHD